MLVKYIAAIFLLVGTVTCIPQGRIVNGTDSDISKHPYLVSIRLKGEHICGASILSPRWILTAAHCLHDFNISDLSVQYGVTEVDPQGPNVVKPKRAIMHWQYEHTKQFPNDIALIELNETLTFNYKSVAPVQLPEENFEIEQVIEGRPAEIMGWGVIGNLGITAKTLQEGAVKIFSEEECIGRFKVPVSKDQICAGVDKFRRGTCDRDSGGPLIYKGSIQLGVVSLGRLSCGSKPDIFTKVSHYVDWIRRHIY